MKHFFYPRERAEADNLRFEQVVHQFLWEWVRVHQENKLFKLGQSLETYFANDALRDFFSNTKQPLPLLLKDRSIALHLGRRAQKVFFDPESGDPLLSTAEQRIYNLARKLNGERLHIPFRSVQVNKQTEMGDIADISTYPNGSELLRYNSGNHFASRPANGNVFDENSKRCMVKAAENFQIFFKRGFLEDRLREVKETSAVMNQAGMDQLQFFLICSRHSQREGHFGVSLVVVDPVSPDIPRRVLVGDTLLKDLPQHPRWWNQFITAYSNAFGNSIAEIIEDISHPLQKVNIKGDEPHRHDWDCPYYSASMTEALAGLITNNPQLILSGSVYDIYEDMKGLMPDYYYSNHEIKDRMEIQHTNWIKRWNSGREMIWDMISEINCRFCSD